LRKYKELTLIPQNTLVNRYSFSLEVLIIILNWINTINRNNNSRKKIQQSNYILVLTI
jgi:hypothetical protein